MELRGEVDAEGGDAAGRNEGVLRRGWSLEERMELVWGRLSGRGLGGMWLGGRGGGWVVGAGRRAN